MDVSRRLLLQAGVALGSFFLSGCEAEPDVNIQTGANGLYIQPWFEDGFLDLKDELAEAHQEGKILTLLFEQAGCPYCLEMHKVNFMAPSIKDFMVKNFRVIQLDIKGSREVTDFAGQAVSEAQFAKQWGVHFSPTVSFLPREATRVVGQKGRAAEAFRLTGFWKAFHFETVLHFVHSGSYKNDDLQRFLNDRLDRLRSEGKNIKVWD